MATSHPYDVYHTINLVTQCLCIPIVSIFVALRFYVRFRFRLSLGVEDSYCAVGIVLGEYGGGYHFGDLSHYNQIQFKKFSYIATILYCPMALSVKIALLAILTRIFSPYRGKVWFIYILLACLCTYYTIALVIKIRMCHPIPLYWLGDEEQLKGACFDQQAAFLADSVISAVSDLIILVLPLPLTWSLQMSRNRKLRVIGLLSAGGLATAFSVYRLVLVLKDGKSNDMSIMFICVIMSGNAEAGIGLICACLPVLNVLYAHYRRETSSQRYYDQGSDIQMRARKSGNNSHLASHRTNVPDFGSQTDQSHLISFAGAPEVANSIYEEDGIRKTVAMSQTVENAASGSR
ncbi:hypothetical protein POX_a01529 [Penicillium oxalicum]|uniref:hypothetical protein n=1 Tax=Penicillium oxalicum TaxID=69781 RepID=UPI0020B685F1|nr:hypothetical protein POX_a01529 [Penicillium oxalicum]KAI2794928.1 hypothetical protein POX_a01529 [Penicillium oxalicum]